MKLVIDFLEREDWDAGSEDWQKGAMIVQDRSVEIRNAQIEIYSLARSGWWRRKWGERMMRYGGFDCYLTHPSQNVARRNLIRPNRLHQLARVLRMASDVQHKGRYCHTSKTMFEGIDAKRKYFNPYHYNQVKILDGVGEAWVGGLTFWAMSTFPTLSRTAYQMGHISASMITQAILGLTDIEIHTLLKYEWGFNPPAEEYARCLVWLADGYAAKEMWTDCQRREGGLKNI